MVPASSTEKWTSRSGKTLDQLVADAKKQPITHYNALPFRPARLPGEDTPTVKPVGRTTIMRGLQRLANLAPTIMSQLDTKADAIADKLVAQQARAEAVIGQFDGLATTLGKVADDVSAALGQITNDPTQVSGG